jgi:hypothetical protein
MQLDLDISDLSEMKFPILNPETKLLISYTIVSAFSLEPRISWFIACFDSAEEGF